MVYVELHIYPKAFLALNLKRIDSRGFQFSKSKVILRLPMRRRHAISEILG